MADIAQAENADHPLAPARATTYSPALVREIFFQRRRQLFDTRPAAWISNLVGSVWRNLG
jgi:hypothetical protein